MPEVSILVTLEVCIQSSIGWVSAGTVYDDQILGLHGPSSARGLSAGHLRVPSGFSLLISIRMC